jgi:phosphonoacetaldehyde hydrolase
VNYTGRLKGVILDWAGTTVDHGSRAPVEAFVEAFRRRSIDVTVEQVRRFMGMPKRDHLRAVLEVVLRREPESDLVDSIYSDFTMAQMTCLERYSQMIPGAFEAVENFRARGLKIGTTTGYTRPMMEIVAPHAARQGLFVDTIVCAGEVPEGRPHPWMALEAAKRLGLYPMQALVKVGDTVADVGEGLSAGMWTIALAAQGNEVGLGEEELERLPAVGRERVVAIARERLHAAGAHYVVDRISEVPALLDVIERRLAAGEKP